MNDRHDLCQRAALYLFDAQAGIEYFKQYRHFKGGAYRPLMTAKNSENHEEMLVIYQSNAYGTVWARPLAMWQEETDRWPDGVKRPRFVPETPEVAALFVSP